MLIKKTIEEMDRDFAKEAGITYEQFTALTLLEQSKIRRKITNKRLTNKNQ